MILRALLTTAATAHRLGAVVLSRLGPPTWEGPVLASLPDGPLLVTRPCCPGLRCRQGVIPAEGEGLPVGVHLPGRWMVVARGVRSTERGLEADEALEALAPGQPWVPVWVNGREVAVPATGVAA